MKKIACPKKKNFSHYLVLFFCFLFLIIPSISQASEHSTSDPYYNKIQKRGKLIIGLSADYAPYEFHTTVKGKDTIVGFDVSIAQKIAKDLGVKLQIEELGFDALLGALKTGKIDLIISGMSPTPERLKEVDFTTPYMTIRQRIVVRRADQAKFCSPNDFQGVKVAAQKQTIQEELAKNELIGAKVTSLQRIPEIMMCLTNKKVDAVVLEEPVADAYLQKQPDLAYANVPLQADKKETAIALPKQAPVLKQKINATLSTIKEKHLLKDYQQKANEQMFQKESFLKKYSPYFLNGALYTIFLAIIGVFFGALIGGILALGKRSTNRLWKGLASIYIEYVRGTPLLVQIFLVYFGTAALGLDLNKLVAGCIALSLNSGAYVAEIVRAGINGVAKGQMEAARSLGMNPRQAMRHVIFPQAIKNILPALGNEFVTVIKESSVISVIGVSELMFQAGNVQGASFKPFLPYLIVSLIYFVLTFTLSKCLGVAERRMKTSD